MPTVREKLVVETLRAIESDVILVQNKVARLLKVFDEEPYSLTGIGYIRMLEDNYVKEEEG